MKYFLKTVVFVFLMLSSSHTMAQDASKKDDLKFKLQYDYLSNYAYNGRIDSIKSPYHIIAATLSFPSGIYINGAANYLITNGQSDFDFFQLDLGYEYTIGKKWSGEIYGSKYFYSGNANLINGNITSDLGVSVNYDASLFQLNNTFDLFFSSSSDFQFTPGIEKDIEIKRGESTWNITPGVYCNFSSLNYYQSVVNRKLNGGKGSKKLVNPNAPIVTNITSVNKPGFTYLDLEMGLPITYAFQNWTFSFSPTYAIPQNPIATTSLITTKLSNGNATVVKENSTPYSELNLKNIFFVQLGVSYTF